MDNPSKINASSCLTFMPIDDSIAVYINDNKRTNTLWN
jgi:hypothetical protein